jgi:hypothetical protein
VIIAIGVEHPHTLGTFSAFRGKLNTCLLVWLLTASDGAVNRVGNHHNLGLGLAPGGRRRQRPSQFLRCHVRVSHHRRCLPQPVERRALAETALDGHIAHDDTFESVAAQAGDDPGQ